MSRATALPTILRVCLASVQSDQSLCWGLWVNKRHKADTEYFDQPTRDVQADLSLRWASM